MKILELEIPDIKVTKVDFKPVDLNDLTKQGATPEEVYRAALATALTQGAVVKIGDLRNTAQGGALVTKLPD